MSIRKGLIAICVVALGLSCLESESAEAATLLSDPQLAGVSGGAVDLPQDPQKPNQNHTDPGPIADPQDNDGMDRPPMAVAVLQSKVNIDYRRNLMLGQTTQQNSRALNLENQVACDTIGTTNIIGGRLLMPTGTTTRLLFKQNNQLNQLHRQQGRLDSSPAGYRYETTVLTRLSDENFSHHASSFLEIRDRSESFHHHRSVWDVHVGKVSLPEFIAHEAFPLEIIAPWEYELIPYFEVGDTVDAGWFGEYGAVLTYGPLVLQGPTASFDRLERLEDDLVVYSTLELPALDFGDLSFKGCVGGCLEGTIDLGSIGGTNIFEVLEAIDNLVMPGDLIGFSSDGIVLEGLGALLEDELNLNTGFVFAGQGHFKTIDLEPNEPGPAVSVNIGGDVSLNAAAVLDVTIDLNNEVIAKALGTDSWSIREDFDLINVTVPFTFLNLEVDHFDIEFDGVVVAQLGAGEVWADELEHFSSDTSFYDNSRISHSFEETISESTFSESVVHTTFTGGRMTAAEAELLAMSEGALKVNNNSNVFLSESAQKSMRVLNGVNAVSAIAANSLNVGQMPSFVRGSTGARQVSLMQQNNFVQQR